MHITNNKKNGNETVMGASRKVSVGHMSQEGISFKDLKQCFD